MFKYSWWLQVCSHLQAVFFWKWISTTFLLSPGGFEVVIIGHSGNADLQMLPLEVTFFDESPKRNLKVLCSHIYR